MQLLLRIVFLCLLSVSFISGFAQFKVLHDFEGSRFDFIPRGIHATSDSIYVITNVGGPDDRGTFFRIDHEGNGYEVIHEFDATSYGPTSLIGNDTIIYISANQGSAGPTLHAYKFGEQIETIKSLAMSESQLFRPQIIADSGVWITSIVSTEDQGSIAFIRKDGSEFTKIYNNTGNSTGAAPLDLLFYDNTFHIAFSNGGGIHYPDESGSLVASGSFGSVDLDGQNFRTTLQGQEGVGTEPVSIVEWNGRIYGQFTKNGNSTTSKLFSMKPDGSDFSLLGTLNWSGRLGLQIRNDSLFATTVDRVYAMDLNSGSLAEIIDMQDYETFDAIPIFLTEDAIIMGTGQGGAGGAGAIFSFKPFDTQFLTVSGDPSVMDGSQSSGIAWGDYNNDGYQDLFINVTIGGTSSENLLFENNGDGTFTDVTASAGVDESGQGRDATWGDYNNDGFLDLYVTNGYQNYLYRNKGDETFEKITTGDIVTSQGIDSNGSNWGDFNNDGFLDLFIATSSGGNFLYRNNGDGSFTNESSSAITSDDKGSISGSWIDFDNNDSLDLLVSNYNSTDQLFRNENGSFNEVNNAPNGSFSVGSSWGDYDNDGDFDLVITNNISQDLFFENNGDGTFSTKTTSISIDNVQANTSAWGDFDNDGWIDLALGSSKGTFLFQNGPDGFTEVAQSMGVKASSFVEAIAWADVNNDGFLDLYVANSSGSNMSETNNLFLNNGNSNNWLSIKLIGTNSNKDAIGSKVRIKTDRWQVRTIQSETGNNAQNSMTMHFGLLDESMIDTLLVEWLGQGTQLMTDIRINQHLELTEPASGFPNPPINFDVVHTSPDKGKLTWTDQSNDELGFIVQRSTDRLSYRTLDTLDINSETYIDEDINTTATYYYRVASLGINGYSTYTPVKNLFLESDFQYTSTVDSMALVALYNATDGDNWTFNDNWLEDRVENWYGVSVRDGYVDSIHIRRENNLIGEIPGEFFTFEKLRWLRIASNSGLTGPIPENIGDMTSLQYLSFFYNNHTGEIPATITNLDGLEILLLPGNNLQGSIPQDIGDMESLNVIAFSFQSLSGKIPESLYNLPHLERLFLRDNAKLTGELSRLAEMNTLTTLSISGCNFSGEIPITLAKENPFTNLSLDNNNFSSMADFSEVRDQLPPLIRIDSNRIGYDDLYVNRELIGANANQRPFELNGMAIDVEKESISIDYNSFLEVMPKDQITSTSAYFQWEKDGLVLEDQTTQSLPLDWADGEGSYQLAIQSIPFEDIDGFAGSISYSTDPWCGGTTVTGSLEITPESQHLFTVTDFSFGAYSSCYGTGTALGRNLKFYLIDGELALFGLDVFGDTWWLNSVEVNGVNMTIEWENSYQESGTSVLTRDDGANWPEITVAPRYTGDLVDGFPADFEFPVYVQSKTIEVTATPPSSDTDYEVFEIQNQEGETTIDEENHTIAAGMPKGTDLSALIANFELSTGATAKINEQTQVSSETVIDFSSPVIATITAQDESTTQDWTITVTEQPSHEADLLTFSLSEQTGDATIEDDTIRLTVSFGTDLTALVATFNSSEGSSVAVGGTAQTSGTSVNDFSSPVTYTVTAEDGTITKDWIVIVSEAANSAAEILSFSLSEHTGDATIENDTIRLTVSFGTDLTALVATFNSSEGSSVAAGGTAQTSGTSVNDFSSPVTYTVTAEDGTTTKDWIIIVSEAANSAAELLSFSFAEQTGDATIENDTIRLTVSFGTDLTALVATFTASEEASVAVGGTAQTSGTSVNDFSSRVTYTVTAEDGTATKDWTIIVSEAANSAAEILSFSLSEQTGDATIENDTIRLTVSFGTDLTALVATFNSSEGSSVAVGGAAQTSGTSVNDFSSPVTYTVTAEDGTTTKDWIIIVSEAANTAAAFVSFSLDVQVNEALLNSEQRTIRVEVPFGTDLTNLKIAFTLSSGASAAINGESIRIGSFLDFSSDVTVLVTAADGITQQQWVVRVFFSANVDPTVSAETFMLDENPFNNMLIGTIQANDPDNNALTYYISTGNESDAFRIDETNGELYVADSVQFDFETNPVFMLQVSVIDARGGEGSNTITVKLQDLDETILGFDFQDITIYPNPTTGLIQIRHPQLTSVTVYDPSGKQILSSTHPDLDLSAIDPGIYLVMVKLLGGRMWSKKILKK